MLDFDPELPPRMPPRLAAMRALTLSGWIFLLSVPQWADLFYAPAGSGIRPLFEFLCIPITVILGLGVAVPRAVSALWLAARIGTDRPLAFVSLLAAVMATAFGPLMFNIVLHARHLVIAP